VDRRVAQGRSHPRSPVPTPPSTFVTVAIGASLVAIALVVYTLSHPYRFYDHFEWQAAAFGMLGLETALSIVQATMVDTGALTWADVAERMSYAPARIGRLDHHGRPLVAGEPANVVLYDPAATRTVEAGELSSLSRNTPYAGMELPGRVVATFLRGKPTVLDGKLA